MRNRPYNIAAGRQIQRLHQYVAAGQDARKLLSGDEISGSRRGRQDSGSAVVAVVGSHIAHLRDKALVPSAGREIEGDIHLDLSVYQRLVHIHSSKPFYGH